MVPNRMSNLEYMYTVLYHFHKIDLLSDYILKLKYNLEAKLGLLDTKLQLRSYKQLLLGMVRLMTRMCQLFRWK